MALRPTPVDARTWRAVALWLAVTAALVAAAVAAGPTDRGVPCVDWFPASVGCALSS